MWTHALLMLTNPRRAIPAILRAKVRMRTVVGFLFWVGLLRGILEIIWLFAINGRLGDVPLLARHGPWWVLEGGPFIVANILTAYFRWALYSTVFVLLLRVFRIRWAFADDLRVFGAMLGLYVVTILVNFLHGVFDLKMLHLYVAERYVPAFGIGQALAACLMLRMVFVLGRLLSLDRSSALLAAFLVVLVERGLNLAAAWWYFRLPLAEHLSARSLFLVANHLTSLVSLVGVALLIWLGRRLHAKQPAHP